MGTKNKPAASKEKTQSKESKSKSKKDKGGQPKAEIVVTLQEKDAEKFLKGTKVFTVQELASQTGVKISAANKFLLESMQKGTVKRVGGYSGHHIYQSA